MGLLTEVGHRAVHHYAPLHYLPFIARARSLYSKPVLRGHGYADHHFRSKSRRTDESRGFARYVHLTLHSSPPILLAKLKGGFPHVRLEIPSSAVEHAPYDLCRYNVAMTRTLRRDGKPGHKEAPENGRYYDELVIPVARDGDDQRALLHRASRTHDMVEVLVRDAVALPDATRVHCYQPDDAQLAASILAITGCDWEVVTDPRSYERHPAYVREVRSYVSKALRDANWKGNGLEFDDV